MSKLANVWVFSDNVERYAELMAGARLWGEQVHLIVQGSDQANQLQALGADKIVVLDATSGLQRVENYAETIAALMQEHAGLLLMSATKRAKSLGARLSIQLNAAMVNDATSVTLDAGILFAEHRMYGGLAFGKEKSKVRWRLSRLPQASLNRSRKTPHTTARLSQQRTSRRTMK